MTTVSLAVLGIAAMWACASTTAPSPAAPAGGESGADAGSGGCSPPEDAACQVDPQCGCPSGQKCDFSLDSGVTCIHAGTGTTASVCETASDCAAGLTCASGVCHPFCAATEVGSQCPTAAGGAALGLCNQVNVDASAVPQDSYCFFDCTPSPNDCPTGQGCVINTVEGTNYSDCQAAGPIAAGGACATNASCAAGTMCRPSGATGNLCLQLCRTAADCASLGAALTCDMTIGLAMNGVLYGLCAEETD